MLGENKNAGVRQGLGSGPRATIFAVAALVLLGLALIAGGVGPWTDRDISASPSKPRTRPPDTASAPTVTRPTQIDTQHVPSAVNWGLRLLVIGVLVGLIVLVAIWLVRKIKELAEDRGERVGGDGLPMQVGMEAPPRISERASGRDFDPRAAADAIISCWLWVESAAAAQGFARRQQDTPTEFLQRFVRRGRDDADDRAPAADLDSGPDSGNEGTEAAAEVLLPLYQRARFDHVALTEDAALTARSAAETLCAGGRGAAARVARAGPPQEAGLQQDGP